MATIKLKVNGDGKSGDPKPPTPSRIPLPDYNNPESRLAYAKAFRDKYGSQFLEGYGDIPLRVNEKPNYTSSTSKELAMRAAKAVGVDPALFYASSMIEGQSGLYPGSYKKGGPNANRWTGVREYPVSGLYSFGLDSFENYLPTLKKKGYLPQDFDKNFTVWKGEGSPAGPQYDNLESVMFKNTDAGVQAKAAMMRAFYDELDDYAKNKNVKLTPEQRNFFALAHFNSGSHGYEMLDAYNKAGLLKGQDFINKMPDIPVQGFIDFYKKKGKNEQEAKMLAQSLHKQIYGNVLPRLLAAKGLREEGLFDDPEQMQAAAQALQPQAPTSDSAKKVMVKITK